MITHATLLTIAALALMSCAPRGIIETAAPVPDATVRDIYVARFRQDTGEARNFGEAREGDLAFGRVAVSIPPDHRVGRIEWPRGPADARTDFATVGGQAYPDIDQFVRSVAASDRAGTRETVLHVHGYNTTHGEAVYGTAQVAHDLNVPVPMVVFSWPSAAQATGYIYDRDSALISRDKLEDLIVALAQQPDRTLFLTAHSMGSFLLMETLRQIAQSGRLDLARDLNGVLLMAPDIDTELFREQIAPIGDLPEPFIVMIAEQDRALRISGLLTGRGVRLGTATQPELLIDLGITVVDVGALSDGRRFDHNIATTSPAALAVFRKLNEVAPPGDLHVVDSVIKADQAEGFLSRLATGP
ncbi:MAG: alpha/beta hydrolase [Pseudomonadota bacterium]